jgi:predicted RNase H-like HicB family nuclease
MQLLLFQTQINLEEIPESLYLEVFSRVLNRNLRNYKDHGAMHEAIASTMKKISFDLIKNPDYTISIQRSDDDNCFIASLPEWGDFCHIHGNTYAEALKNAGEVLELLIKSALEEGETLSEVRKFAVSS